MLSFKCAPCKKVIGIVAANDKIYKLGGLAEWFMALVLKTSERKLSQVRILYPPQMNNKRLVLFLARICLGWLYFYAGIVKVLDENWTSAGYLKGAKVMSGAYTLLLGDSVLPVIDFLNKWGLTFLGLSLIVGAGMRISVRLGVLLMVLYYIPVMRVPFVDQHVIYSLVLILLLEFGADKIWGVKGWVENKKWVKKSFLKWLV